MNINFKLTNSDFLAYQLYTSSKSKLHSKRRSTARFVIPLIYIGFALYTYLKNGNLSFSVILVGVAIVWFLIYPLYSRWRYKRHFQKRVEENYKNRIHRPVEIEINGSSVNARDSYSESKINASELKELIDTPNHFFIKLKTDLSLIIPKHSIGEQIEFKNKLTDLGVTYIDEKNWEWK